MLIIFGATMFAAALAIGTARADCDQKVDPAIRQTPVGSQVCGEQPQPKPTTSPTTAPQPKPTHAPTSHPKPAQQTRTDTAPLAAANGTHTSALGISPQESGMHERLPPIDTTNFLDSVPSPYQNYRYPGYSQFGIKPKAGRDTYGLRIMIMLGLALGGTVWLRGARVRNSMIGLSEETA